ncbi:MAG: rane protein [Rhodocyclales bacterium]|nr:rane protein [Rhodocyclales bacterium]
MSKVAIAWVRAARSLMRPDIFWHMLWPTLIAFALWLVVAVLVWSEAAVLLLQFVQGWPWVGHWFVTGAAQALVLTGFAHVMLVLLFVPLSLLTAAVLIAVVALPLMLDRVAASDYPDLVQRRGGSQLGSVANALWALLLFIVFAALSLPLWLIPGMGVLLSIMLSAWLNQRCYRYDVLMRHADRHELQRLPSEHRGALYLIGGAAGVLVFVPIFNFFVPALSGLAFVHYLLQALRESRGMVEVVYKTG